MFNQPHPLSTLDNLETKCFNLLRGETVQSVLDAETDSVGHTIARQVQAHASGQHMVCLPTPCVEMICAVPSWDSFCVPNTRRRKGWALVAQHLKHDQEVGQLLAFPPSDSRVDHLQPLVVHKWNEDGLRDVKLVADILARVRTQLLLLGDCHRQLTNEVRASAREMKPQLEDLCVRLRMLEGSHCISQPRKNRVCELNLEQRCCWTATYFHTVCARLLTASRSHKHWKTSRLLKAQCNVAM